MNKQLVKTLPSRNLRIRAVIIIAANPSCEKYMITKDYAIQTNYVKFRTPSNRNLSNGYGMDNPHLRNWRRLIPQVLDLFCNITKFPFRPPITSHVGIVSHYIGGCHQKANTLPDSLQVISRKKIFEPLRIEWRGCNTTFPMGTLG